MTRSLANYMCVAAAAALPNTDSSLRDDETGSAAAGARELLNAKPEHTMRRFDGTIGENARTATNHPSQG